MSLVEVIVAAAVLALIFGGLFQAFQTSIQLIGKSKIESGALALANERLEYIRSLPYDDVGTVGGIPDGAIPQNASTTLNGITYNERVLVEYVDAPEDGEGADDENGIVADYKRVKIEYSWDNRGETESLALVSNIVPQGVETTAGGGTLRVNVFDAAVGAVEDAEVHVYNDTGTTTIDTIKYTNESGVALFSGAPALASYQITATKDGFSTDGTYTASSTNPNPTTPPVAVLEGQVSTMNFQIDELADLTVQTVGEPTIESFSDSFDDTSGTAASSSVSVSGGAVALAGSAPYPGSGSLRSVDVEPVTFSAWDTASFTTNTPADTNVLVHIYSTSGTSTSLVPDAVISGNSTGFATGTISLTGVDTVTYPSLALGADLATTNASSTPQLLDWELTYTVSEPPIGNVPFTLTGNKTIGTGASSTPVYKYERTHITDSGGSVALTDLEWDVYSVVLGASSYDIKEACGNIPYSLLPGASDTLKLTLASSVTNSLRVRVEDTSGATIAGAAVQLARTGFSEALTSSACGQVFFNSGVSAAADYSVTVDAAGYESELVEDVTVGGAASLTVVLSEV